MKTFALTAALLISAASAATVKLQETPCIGNTTQLDSFDIEVGSLVVKDLPSVCGLKIVSASGVDLSAVTCQAFKDAQGKDPGSAKFTAASPALIATNPVQEGSILCTASGSSASASASTTVSTLVSIATGGATPSGNATVPVATGTPKPSASPTPSGTSGAGRVGMGVGVVAAAFAALLL